MCIRDRYTKKGSVEKGGEGMRIMIQLYNLKIEGEIIVILHHVSPH
jgi:hypothetical protein